jgi:ATP-dependent Lhr-like helicase
MVGQRVGRAFFSGFQSLRPVQQRAFQPILQGEDVLIRAGTGAGKTEAATAPLVERYLTLLDRCDGVTLLYLSPTRALANDLLRRLSPVFDKLSIGVGVRHGERDDLSRAAAPAVLITTPESLDVLVGKREPTLAGVQAVVLDEIHLLMNNQRGLQLAVAVHRLELWLGRTLQVVGLSATVANPNAVWRFFRPSTTAEVITDTDPPRAIERQIRIHVSRSALSGLLAQLSGGATAKILAFTNSKSECDLLADELRTSSGFGPSVFAHHAGLDKHERQRVEREFQARRRAICVATSTLELGIDIGDIDLIVLYGVPSNWQSFLQRIGRGSRRRDTVEVLCVAPEPPAGRTMRLRDLLGFQALMQQVNTTTPNGAEAFALYGAAAQQLVSTIDAGSGGFVGINRLAEVLAPWPHLGRDAVFQLLDELSSRAILQRHPVYRRYGADEGLWELRRTLQLWSNLPLSYRDIEIHHGSTQLGQVPASNLLRIRKEATFAFAGRRWVVTEVHSDRIKVVPTERKPSIELASGRRGAPLDPALVEQIRVLIASGAVASAVVPSARGRALEAELAPLRPFASEDVLPVADEIDHFIYVTFAGSLANQVIASWAGANPRDTTEFTITSSHPVSLADLPSSPADLVDHLRAVEVNAGEPSEFQHCLPPNLRRTELENEWVRVPCHVTTLRRLRTATEVRLPSELISLIDR